MQDYWADMVRRMMAARAPIINSPSAYPTGGMPNNPLHGTPNFNKILLEKLSQMMPPQAAAQQPQQQPQAPHALAPWMALQGSAD